MKVQYHSYQLPFTYPFTISKGTKSVQPSFVVSLEWMGLTGYGEAPEISYYHLPISKMIADLEGKKAFIEKFAFTDPERYWHYLHHLFPGNSFLVCALDMAAWDLYGKIRKQPLYRLWKLDPGKTLVTDYTLGIDSLEKMVAKLRENPWPVYKIKLGTPDDITIVRELRKHTDARLRVDVNEGWTLEEARERIPILHDLGVELIEQPLRKEDREGMSKLYKESSLPLVADESCVGESDLLSCRDHFHGINIKLTKCGGITPARRMIAAAREYGLRVMGGSMNESSLGSAALAHLSPLMDWLDMDGPLLLSRDIATGLSFEEGRPKLTEESGLGVRLLET